MEESQGRNDPLGIRIRVMQIIAGALMAGVVTFLIIVLFLVNQEANPQPGNTHPILTFLAWGFGGLQVMMFSLIPPMIARGQAQRILTGTWQPPSNFPQNILLTDEDKLIMVYQTSMIIAFALVEGAAFFACIAYLLEKQLLVLGVVAVCLILMVFSFPTRERVHNWMEMQLRRREEFR